MNGLNMWFLACWQRNVDAWCTTQDRHMPDKDWSQKQNIYITKEWLTVHAIPGHCMVPIHTVYIPIKSNK